MPLGAAIGAGVAAVGVGSAAAAGAFDPDAPQTPEDRKVYEEQKRTLDAYEKLYPQQKRLTETTLRDFSALGGELSSAQRQQELADLEAFGPRALETFRRANPQQTQLLDELNRQAQAGLQAGTGLTPAEQRVAQQQVRAAQAARGMGFGNRDAFQEALALYGAGTQRQLQRQQFAGNVLGYNAALSDLPYRTILGRSAYDYAQAQTPNSQADNPYAADVYNTNYNAQAAALIAQANNSAATRGAGLGIIGGALGGIGGGFARRS